jgi:Ca-activated chloride channel family protein
MKYAFLFLLLLSASAIAFTFPPRKITGTVLTETNIPLTGTNVSVKGTGVFAITDAKGQFSILVNDDNAILVFSSPGYETKQISLGKENTVIVRMRLVTVAKEAQMAAVSVLGEMMSRNSVMGTLKVSGIVGTMSHHPDGYQRPRYYDREGYDKINDNPFMKVNDNPLSTFSIDVDAASYSNVRRILNSGQLPQLGAVRIEEMINYFSYEYAQPVGKAPFAVHTELRVCPWNTSHQLVLIGLQGKKIEVNELPPSNLTFLIDVSGSMSSRDKLPLVKESLKLLVDQLRPIDKVAIVVYAGNAGLVLPLTSGDRKMAIREAIEQLESGGSTAGGQGIKLAYSVAKEHMNKEGNNRVILCTDGDFNVGLSSDDALERMIEEERKSGVFLTVLGFGTGNYQDAKMQKLADKGNGNHAYIDQLSEAKKVLINEFGGTLFTIAKDVKLQVEFNPAKIKGYRLIGYENRMLAKEDFNDDRKDAGDMGSGHTVTALYELVPQGVAMPETGKVDSLRYQTVLPAVSTEQAKLADEVLNIKLRYKEPDGDKSSMLSFPVKGKALPFEQASNNFRFAAAVASFGMLLRESEHKGNSSYAFVKSLAQSAVGEDKEGYRKEFLQLLDKTSAIGEAKGRSSKRVEL